MITSGVTRHRYVRIENLKDAMTAAGNYRKFRKMMAEIRRLNRMTNAYRTDILLRAENSLHFG